MQDVGQLIVQHGLALIFANVLLDQLGFPAPAIPALMVAGALAADGRLLAPEVFLVSVVATLIADSAWFLAGRRYGNGVGWTRFLLFSTLGAGLWVGAGMGAGLVLREQIDYLLEVLESAGGTAIIVLGALFVTYVAYKWWERHRFFTMLRMARISVDELSRLMDAGASPVIVDVRTQTARELEPRRIPGALHVPLDAIDEHARDLPRDRDIILYCTCPNEISAAEAAKLLMNSGLTRVRPLHGGLDAWIAAGYEVEDPRG
jgi:rhodanese-related sulfurtransferase/membrane protein DedA with SNARE-associated domain